MAAWMILAEAASTDVRDGDTLAMEGLVRLIPFVAGHALRHVLARCDHCPCREGHGLAT